MAVSTVVSMAASCPTAPAGVWGNPAGTPAGPAVVAGGTSSGSASRAVGVPPRAAAASTASIGAAATASRRSRAVVAGASTRSQWRRGLLVVAVDRVDDEVAQTREQRDDERDRGGEHAEQAAPSPPGALRAGGGHQTHPEPVIARTIPGRTR